MIIADIRLTNDAEKFIQSTRIDQLVFVKTDVTKRDDLENLFTISEKAFHDVPGVYIAGAGVFEPVSSPYTYESLLITTG